MSKLRPWTLFVVAISVALASSAAGSLSAAEAPRVDGAEAIGGSVTPFVFHGDLRDLPPAPVWRFGDPVREVPRRTTATGLPERTPPTPRLDPLLARQARVTERQGFTDPLINQAGQSFNGVQPPDPSGDVGSQFFIQAINAGAGTTIVVYDKTDGSTVAGPIVLDGLGSAECADGFGDPIVLYDELADRWMLSEFAFQGFFGGVLCVYVSQTSDPVTGGWFNYLFEAQDFPDYPKYGIWPDAYYVSSNEGRPAAYALDRTNMLNGAAARPLQRFTADRLGGFGFETLTAVDHDGALAPVAGSPGYFMRHKDDESHDGPAIPGSDTLEIFEFDVDFDNPSNSSFTGPISIQVTDFDSNLCGLNSFECIEQPGSADLDPLREVIMYRAAYRNFGTHETLTGTYATDVNGNDLAGVRWFELRRTGGAWSLFQEGTWAPNNLNRWMSSGAMDADGNFAVGYSVASQGLEPSLAFTGRLATDPLGTLPQGEGRIIRGQGSNTSNRYGDYAQMSVDPVGGCIFWFTAEYNPSSQWGTRIVAFQFDECVGLAE